MSFVSQSITIACPLTVLREMFEEETAGWMVPFVRLASLEGRAEADRMHARFGRVARTTDLRGPHAAVDVGQRSVRVEPPGFTFELTWRSTGYGPELAAFAGRLVAVPLSAEETMLTLEGKFDAVTQTDFNERLADRRAAESTLRSLLRLLRTAVEEAENKVR